MTTKEMLYEDLLRRWAEMFQTSPNPVYKELAERTFAALRAGQGKSEAPK